MTATLGHREPTGPNDWQEPTERSIWPIAIAIALLLEVGIIAGLVWLTQDTKAEVKQRPPVKIVVEAPKQAPKTVAPPKPKPPTPKPPTSKPPAPKPSQPKPKRVEPPKPATPKPPPPKSLTKPKPAPKPRPQPHHRPKPTPKPKPVRHRVVHQKIKPVPQPPLPRPPVVPPKPITPPVDTAPPTPIAPPAPDLASIKADFERKMRSAIQSAVRYPAAAKMMRLSGRVLVGFDYQDGTISNVHVLTSSQSTLLDRAALVTVRQAAYPSVPAVLKGKRLSFDIWVGFRLRN